SAGRHSRSLPRLRRARTAAQNEWPRRQSGAVGLSRGRSRARREGEWPCDRHMTQWLDTKSKPATAVDGCWTKEGTRIDAPATFDGPGKCNELFPSHKNPRLVAGAPLTDDIAKCQLK